MVPRVATDAVPLQSLTARRGPTGPRHLIDLKSIIVLFVLFIFVVSDVFTSCVISGFGGAVSGRTPTSYGIAVQGVFLVLFYNLVLYLIDGGLI
jgi:hypothetical protein